MTQSSSSSSARSQAAPFLVLRHFIPSLAGTFVVVLVHWLISYITQNSALLGYIVKGKDTVLIRNGEIDREALAASHMSEDDLEEDRACYCESSATLSQMSFDTRVMATLLWLFHVI